jgi:hypothetical protein
MEVETFYMLVVIAIYMHCLNIEGLIVGKANSAPLSDRGK